MSQSRSLRQLLRVRQIEEEQSRITLEAGLGELNRLERMLVMAHERERKGGALIRESFYQATTLEDAKMSDHQNNSYCISEQGLDRRAALGDVHAARKLIESIKPKLKAVQERIEQLRAAYLASRVERRQVETLIFEENARHQSEVEHRAQQAIDDWFGGRLTREKQASERRKGIVQGEIPANQTAATEEYS